MSPIKVSVTAAALGLGLAWGYWSGLPTPNQKPTPPTPSVAQHSPAIINSAPPPSIAGTVSPSPVMVKPSMPETSARAQTTALAQMDS
ncbi:MAG: hypothetical protein WBM66_07370, partial [Thiothrix litoralis]